MTSNDTQQEIVQALGVAPDADPEIESERRIVFLADYLRRSGASGYVLGISGGLDSTVAGRMAREASHRVGGRFTALRLPYRTQADEEDAQTALRFIAPDATITINVGDAVDSLQSELSGQSDAVAADFNKGNIKARVRMTAQYAVAG